MEREKTHFILFKLNSWADVRYKITRNNQRCYRDKSNNVRCLLLEFDWDENG